jgi:putative chitinase
MDVRATQARIRALGYDPGAIDGKAGPKTYAALCGFLVRRQPDTLISEIGRGLSLHLRAHRIDTVLRLAHFLAQCAHESQNFTRLVENLNYTSAQRLIAIWPSRFRSVAAAEPFVRNPEALANNVYGGRMGNTAPSDGWRYRGRGIKMITGKDNYTVAARRVGLDLVNRPELAADPVNSVLLACDYWANRAINPLADRDDLEAVTRAINGGLIGLADRRNLLARAKGALL